jgi:hypothetical protein
MINLLRIPLALLILFLAGLASEATASEEGAGNYGGILQPSLIEPPENSGMIQLQLSKTGVATGVLIWQGQRYPFKGEFNASKPLDLSFNKKLSSIPGELRVFMELFSVSRFVSGIFSENQSGSQIFATSIGLNGALPDPTLVEDLKPGLRISFIEPPDPTTEGEGITMLGPSPGPAIAEIPGDGFVHVRISKSKKRSSRLVGRLPDASGAFSAGSPLRGTNYTVFSSLYKKHRRQGGQLFGDANVFDTGNAVNYTSNLRWGKAENFDSLYYPGRFDYLLSLDAVPYPKLKRGALVPLLPQPPSPAPLPAAPYGVAQEPTHAIDARILFRRGNISVPDGLGGFDRFFRQNIKMTPFHTRVVGDNPYRVKIQVDAFSGRFHGSFMHPVLNARTKFRGAFQAAVLLIPGQGRGNFRPPSGPGIVPLAEPLESGGVRINLN